MTYCFTGYPLSGKSTLARKLAVTLNVGCLSTGALARALGMGLEPSIKELDISLEHDREITAGALKAAADCEVLDGFPRSIDQVSALRTQGTAFTVVFVTENPLIVFDRISDRASREGRPEDAPDVVAGRLRRSMEFKRELEDILLTGELVIFDSSRGYGDLVHELGLEP
jgi:adenylate kinase family enzyme